MTERRSVTWQWLAGALLTFAGFSALCSDAVPMPREVARVFSPSWPEGTDKVMAASMTVAREWVQAGRKLRDAKVTPDEFPAVVVMASNACGWTWYGGNLGAIVVRMTPDWQDTLAHELGHWWFGNDEGLARKFARAVLKRMEQP
jgi:hypothetical protein